MPLLKGKSKAAFGHNVATEMEHGKPQKQALAIAYATKRRGKKMAEGGDPSDPRPDSRLESHSHESQMCTDEHCNIQEEHDRHDMAGEPMMAEGGQITDNYQSPSSAWHQTKDGSVNPQKAYTQMHEGDTKRPSSMAMSEDDRKLNQHGEYEEGEQGGGQGYHGESYEGNTGNSWDNYQSTAHDEDMVGRIMKQRQMSYSEGGMVANDTPISAGFKENDFDDLALRDGLEFSDTGANSGDELDNSHENDRRRDIVARIMASRKKKDRLPNPA